MPIAGRCRSRSSRWCSSGAQRRLTRPTGSPLARTRGAAPWGPRAGDGVAQGHEAAWEHFVREHRPLLYRAGTAIAGEFGRELADSLYAELFGLRERDGNRQSLFRYFHGRSSLGTWLRSVLAQRYVDEVRSRRRLDPSARRGRPLLAGGWRVRPRCRIRAAGGARPRRPRRGDSAAVAARPPPAGLVLPARHDARPDRPPLPGARGHRLPSPHPDQEGAAGRRRGPLQHAGLDARAIDECFAAAAADPGDVDLSKLLPGADELRKNIGDIRSQVEERS